MAAGAPPDPRPGLIEAASTMAAEAKARRAEAVLEQQRLQVEQQREEETAMGKLNAKLAELHSEQEAYAPKPAKAEAPPPPPMLPMRDVRADQPVSSVMGTRDVSDVFAAILSAQGNDPGLARGGAAVRQAQSETGPPTIEMPAPELPTPGPTRGGNPTISLGNGETYGAPTTIPVTRATFGGGEEIRSGIRVPTTTSEVTTELRPNVLTPGDILQGRLTQERNAQERSYQRAKLSIDWQAARMEGVRQLMSELPPAVAGRAATAYMRGDVEGALAAMDGVRTYSQQKLDNDTLLTRARMAEAAASARQAAAAFNRENAQADYLKEQTRGQKMENDYFQGMTGDPNAPTGMNSATRYAPALWGFGEGPTLKRTAGGMPVPDYDSINHDYDKGLELLAKATDPTEKTDPARAGTYLGVAGTLIGRRGQAIVQTGDVGNWWSSGKQPTFGTVPLSRVGQVIAIATMDKTQVDDIDNPAFAPSVQAARKQLESWGIRTFDKEGRDSPPPAASPLRPWADQLWQSYGIVRSTQLVANDLRREVQVRGGLDHLFNEPPKSLPGSGTDRTAEAAAGNAGPPAPRSAKERLAELRTSMELNPDMTPEDRRIAESRAAALEREAFPGTDPLTVLRDAVRGIRQSRDAAQAEREARLRAAIAR